MRRARGGGLAAPPRALAAGRALRGAKSNDGHLDVDFFEKEKDGKLSMSDMTIHKVDGKARYGWEEKNGFWKRVPASQ